MRNVWGKLCIVLGTLLILGALALFAFNQHLQARAEAAAAAVLPRLAGSMETQPEEIQEETTEMTRVVIDGHAYIGVVTVPSLSLELPVLADWDSAKLQLAPCRYSGSIHTGDLVLMAHNYPKHFGRLQTLQPGDAVRFTDMDGRTMHCQVTAVEILEAEAVEEMTAGQAQLTLFTCTYGGQGRIAVRCGPAQGKTGNG